MIPEFGADGNLPPGIHWATWDDICSKFGGTTRRRYLLQGLRSLLESLRRAGCRTAYVDGSFVSSKSDPDDFDACWEEDGVNLDELDGILQRFDDGRAVQKAKYRGEVFPATSIADLEGTVFLDFFQIDKETGDPKGIVAVDPGGLS